ncbi:glycosyl hydrolase family 18 protein [Eubacterium xylanophilum]|uniref:glycosyl hydrolase family 18 protein n=1 Tax=Eubacterium xylanophilum TaxID=39497 RepID=UPI000478ACC5|nr:glycosyl hydrolase family 18 protein [Eubacterium xylanophilum]
MSKKIKAIIIIIVALLVCGAIGGAIFIKLAPSFKQRSVGDEFKELGKDEAMIVLNGRYIDERAKLINGTIYISTELANSQINNRIFWDKYDNVMCLATNDGLIKVSAGDMSYTIGESTTEVEQQIIYEDGNKAYVLLDFVKKFSVANVDVRKNPNRVIIESDFNTQKSFVKTTEDVRLRVGPGKKYDYLLELASGTELIVDDDTPAENEHTKVMTNDGISGYLPNKSLGKITAKTYVTDKKEEVFEQKSLGEDVCLAWHNMGVQATEKMLAEGTAYVSGANVLSPTFYTIKGDKGELISRADKKYVDAAHAKGFKVWAVVNDIEKDLSRMKTLTRTSSRTKLINNIMAEVKAYGYDGINIDFEGITKDSAPGFLEFLRELVLVGHKSNLIISVDNYPAMDYNKHYNYAEQGKVVDYVIVMAYDEHTSAEGVAGPVSSISYVRESQKKALENVPKERVVMALPFYSRLWKVKGKKASPSTYGMSGAESAIRANSATPKWDKKTEMYFAEFKSEGTKYEIWLEEETSLEKKLDVVKSGNVAGVAFWKLGFERAATWNMIRRWSDSK